MPQVTIDLDVEENRNIEIFKAESGLKNKRETIKLVIREFFKSRQQK